MYAKHLASLAFGVAALCFGAGQALAGTVNVAVAANFTDASKEIAAAFKKDTGNDAVLSFGSSGSLYTQIKQGAPFQIMLSADQARPQSALKDGIGVQGSEFTYAVGKLVLWSKDPKAVHGEKTLSDAKFTKLSICDPKAAPYGAASVETMKTLKLYDKLQPKLVVGQNITQAYQFVASGNAEVGFVALSQVVDDKSGSKWLVPQKDYTPIRQDAILFKTGADNPTAKAFMTYLKSAKAHKIIEKYGYAFK
jgi:molybdate transport system substrate-binding protein